MSARKTFTDYTEDELAAMSARDRGAGFVDVKALRREGAIAHAFGMPEEPRIKAWVGRMVMKHKAAVVGIHFHGRNHVTGEVEEHSAIPWLAALLIARYGEAAYHWPAAWSEEDVERLATWESGKRWPEGAFLLKPVEA